MGLSWSFDKLETLKAVNNPDHFCSRSPFRPKLGGKGGRRSESSRAKSLLSDLQNASLGEKTLLSLGYPLPNVDCPGLSWSVRQSFAFCLMFQIISLFPPSLELTPFHRMNLSRKLDPGAADTGQPHGYWPSGSLAQGYLTPRISRSLGTR